MLVSGRVQGVCFRAYTCEEARKLGLKGMVRNLADGRVEVIAEGDHDQVTLLEQFCWKGPPSAHVLSVEVFDEDKEGKILPPFGITY